MVTHSERGEQLMKVSTQLHNITLDGDYLDKISPELQELFMTKAKPVTYYSSWSPPEGMKSDEWKVIVEGSSVEVLFKLYPKYESLTYNVQDEELLRLMLLCKQKVTVNHTDAMELVVESPTDVAEEYFLKTMTIMEKYQTQLERFSENTFNEKCNVHTGGNALTEYNQLMLCEDVCTDELQHKLQKGWRILSVCPQPDQRRPDYILGKKVNEPEESAKRY